MKPERKPDPDKLAEEAKFWDSAETEKLLAGWEIKPASKPYIIPPNSEFKVTFTLPEEDQRKFNLLAGYMTANDILHRHTIHMADGKKIRNAIAKLRTFRGSA